MQNETIKKEFDGLVEELLYKEFPKSVKDHHFKCVVLVFLKKEIWTFFETKLNEIREEAVGDWKDSLGFYGFFEFIREVLERTYPLDVFENSKDIGAKITNRLWEVIKLYDEETDGAKSKQTYLSTTKEEQNHAE